LALFTVLHRYSPAATHVYSPLELIIEALILPSVHPMWRAAVGTSEKIHSAFRDALSHITTADGPQDEKVSGAAISDFK